MSSRIPDTHAEAWALLPWLANGRVQASDREWLEAHLAECEDCEVRIHEIRSVRTTLGNLAMQRIDREVLDLVNRCVEEP